MMCPFVSLRLKENETVEWVNLQFVIVLVLLLVIDLCFCRDRERDHDHEHEKKPELLSQPGLFKILPRRCR